MIDCFQVGYGYTYIYKNCKNVNINQATSRNKQRKKEAKKVNHRSVEIHEINPNAMYTVHTDQGL